MAAHKNYIAFVLCLLLAGCQLTPTFTTGYRYQTQETAQIVSDASVAVERFEDSRPARIYSTQGKLFLTYVPLIPYVSLPFERLEESIEVQSQSISMAGRGMTVGAVQLAAPEFEDYYYPNSFPRAIAEDLGASGLFKKVEFVNQGSSEGFRYVLTGKIRETPLQQSTTSFGLGMPGVLLWFLPVPMSKTSAAITVDLLLTDQETKSVVWQHSLQGEISRYITLYTSSAMVYGRSGAFSFNLVPLPAEAQVDRHSLFSWHFEALRQAMHTAKSDLIAKLQDYQRTIKK